MKNAFLLAILSVLLYSCTKDTENKPASAATIVGVWNDGNPASKQPTFDASYMQWDSGSLYHYYTSTDSLYIIYPFSATSPDGAVAAQYHYSISPSNTTLTLSNQYGTTNYNRIK